MHEMRHLTDFKDFVLFPYRNGDSPMSPDVFDTFTERNAYSLELRNINNTHISMKEWFEVVKQAQHYGVSNNSFFGFYLPMILNSVL